MASQNICFPISTNIENLNNKYIFDNNDDDDISYGLYDTSGNDLSHNYVTIQVDCIKCPCEVCTPLSIARKMIDHVPQKILSTFS